LALKSTIFKIGLQVSDLDRGYYAGHSLTLARHPSETDERMMARLLAFACHAGDRLAFGKGLSDPGEPDLVETDRSGAITLWIEIGQPDDKAILKACGRAAQVIVLAYGSIAPIWWKAIAGKLDRARNLTVLRLDSEWSTALAKLARRTMELHVTIQDGTLWVGDGVDTIECRLEVLLEPRR
jgi:uncharacterized protein YaeQ